MRRTIYLCFGVMSYLIFLGVFLYSMAFFGNVGLTRTLDSAPRVSLGHAVLVNFVLLALFAIQHSGMARPAFKRWWQQWVPQPIERSTYVLATNLVFITIFLGWQPMGGTLWNLEGTWAKGLMYSVYGLGWALVFYASLLIDHFELFGMRQVWRYAKGEPVAEAKFSTPGLYQWIRHPIYVGWLIVFWATPVMSFAHLFFAVLTTGYILMAIRWEERDLVAALPEYAAYRTRVPMLVANLSQLFRNRSQRPRPFDSECRFE